MSVDESLSIWGLKPIELAARATLDAYFASLTQPLSDYTFSQLYTWSSSLDISWTLLDGHLCVFARGAGALKLLLPPLGDTNGDRALKTAFDLMADHNAHHGLPGQSCVEYVSEELLCRFDRRGLDVEPMGADYIYDVQRIIDLSGRDLASKRHAKNRFLRGHEVHVEPYVAPHRDACLALLDAWKGHKGAPHLGEPDSCAFKRDNELLATARCLESAEALGMQGMVVHVRRKGEPGAARNPAAWSLRAFTFGELLGHHQSSIAFEKADPAINGLAQFIFSEFCRRHWSHLPLVNVGDDWDIEALAWTKESYRPVMKLRKFLLRREHAAVGSAGYTPNARALSQAREETANAAGSASARCPS